MGMPSIACEIEFRSVIARVEAIPLRAGLPAGLPFPTASFVDQGFCIVVITTASGLTGVGEASSNGGDPLEVVQEFEKRLAERLSGMPTAQAWELAARANRLSGAGQAAMAAVSQAALDIMGKEAGLACWRLLGDREAEPGGGIMAYASGGMLYDDQPPELLLEEAAKIQALGFSAWKFRPPIEKGASHQQRTISPPRFDHRQLVRISRAIRDAVGNPFRLMVDLGCRVDSLDDASWICDALAELDFYMVEEPLPREPANYAALRKHTSLAVAGGESLSSVAQFEPWIEGSLDIVQPDANLAGMAATRQVALAAQERNLRYIPHNWANGIAHAANVHLAAASSANCPMIETSTVYNPLREALVNELLLPDKGVIQVPNTPGLGVTLNPDAVDHYRMR